MHLTYKDVNEAFRGLVSGLNSGEIQTVEEDSRAGKVRRVLEPVTITYLKPRRRVLLNRERDANPFFHLFESLWMLAGRNDVESLSRYNSKIGKIASDDGVTFNGAYGYRWRHKEWWDDKQTHPGDPWIEMTDQLDVLIEHLKKNPNSRRAVLQMWNVEDDLLKIDSSNDVCCNTAVYFSIREEKNWEAEKKMAMPMPPIRYFDMTVTNRSNDVVWGTFGSDVVNLSFLQEYVACCLDAEVGVYNQFSNNLHFYLDNWKPDAWLGDYHADAFTLPPVSYDREVFEAIHLVRNKDIFDQEVKQFVDSKFPWMTPWMEPFLNDVAAPMAKAFDFHKQRRYEDALFSISDMAGVASDWKAEARRWLIARRNKYEESQKKGE